MANVLVCWVCLQFRGSLEGSTEERDTYICKFIVSDNGVTTNSLCRVLNIFLCLLALWTGSQKLHAPVMHISMVWRWWWKGLWLMWPHRYSGSKNCPHVLTFFTIYDIVWEWTNSSRTYLYHIVVWLQGFYLSPTPWKLAEIWWRYKAYKMMTHVDSFLSVY